MSGSGPESIEISVSGQESIKVLGRWPESSGMSNMVLESS